MTRTSVSSVVSLALFTPKRWIILTVKATSKSDLYRLLPSVDELLRTPELSPLIAREGQPAVTEAARAVVAQLREEISAGHLADRDSLHLALASVGEAIGRQLRAAMNFSLRPVINATGVILHT